MWRRTRKGQAAIEYLALVGFVLLLSAPLVLYAHESATALQESTNQLKAVHALDTIEEAAIMVYSQGEPARITYSVEMPPGVTFSEVQGQYIRIRVEVQGGESDLIRFMDFNVTGSIPTERGQHTMVAEAVGRTNVSISER